MEGRKRFLPYRHTDNRGLILMKKKANFVEKRLCHTLPLLTIIDNSQSEADWLTIVRDFQDGVMPDWKSPRAIHRKSLKFRKVLLTQSARALQSPFCIIWFKKKIEIHVIGDIWKRPDNSACRACRARQTRRGVCYSTTVHLHVRHRVQVRMLALPGVNARWATPTLWAAQKFVQVSRRPGW